MIVVNSIDDMKTKVLKLNEPNYDGRFYSGELIESVIKKIVPEIEKNRVFVTYTPPSTNGWVPIHSVAGIVKELYIDKNNLIADIEFINTPNALHAEIAVQKGISHVRTAGLGSIKTIDGIVYVQEDYELICCFLTDNPA